MIAHAVAARLRAEGYEVTVSGDGLQALSLAQATAFDLVILDLLLPGLDGLEVCRRIQVHGAVPVIMLTAKADEVDVVVGLGVGADDYLTKPFSPRELLARVQALLRRVERDQQPQTAVQVVGDVRIDPVRRRVTRAGELVHLTPKEFDLVQLLTVTPGVVHERTAIVAAVWGYRDDASDRTVDSHVRSIRRKLGEELIRTVRGVGYASADHGGFDATA